MPTLMRERSLSLSQMMAVPFTATDVPNAAGAAPGEFVAPWSGTIVGVSVASSDAFETGTVVVRPTINGTGNTGITVSLSSTTQRGTATKSWGSGIGFAAGARLGVDWTKTGTVAPTTNDVSVFLLVVFDTDI